MTVKAHQNQIRGTKDDTTRKGKRKGKQNASVGDSKKVNRLK